MEEGDLNGGPEIGKPIIPAPNITSIVLRPKKAPAVVVVVVIAVVVVVVLIVVVIVVIVVLFFFSLPPGF